MSIPTVETIEAALTVLRGAKYEPTTVYVNDDQAREMGIDLEKGLAEGWAVIVPLDD